MRWESLVSIQNLRLAWRRINTGRNLQHKHFFRDVYLVYETALDQNLKDLRDQLTHNAWKPSHPVRLYIPKPSGLQRPITLLGLEDQILLQAVANVFARKLRSRRREVELITVYSNILSYRANSIFFTRPWQESYNKFQERCRFLFDNGNRWIGHFDLAAYYDTISHDLLTRIVSPNNRYPKTWQEVNKWLKVWSASEDDSETTHGIPQGPIASDFLGEAFFLPIDMQLIKLGVKYVRYVDDIRIFGESENEVRKASIELERFCRDRGLIPQGKKFAISYAESVEDAMGNLPSIPPGSEESEILLMGENESADLLDSCIGGKPKRVMDKSRFRYVMYRAPRSSKVLNQALRLMPRHPEHIDAFVAYFGNYDKGKRLVTEISQYLESGVPYMYVRGELWHLLARLGTREQISAVLDMARQDTRHRQECLGLSWGVMNFLIRCQQEGLCRIGKRLNTEPSLSLSLLASRLPDTEFAKGKIITRMLKGTIEEQLAAARQLQARNVTLNQLGLRTRDLSCVCTNSLKSLGVIRRASRGTRDWIAERLAKRYGIQDHPIWRTLLTTEYEHALQILIEADAMYDVAPSTWMQTQDSFNDLTIRKFVDYLYTRGLNGGTQKLIGRDKIIVKYGVILQTGNPLATAHPVICSKLLTFHERRNGLPGSHPYEQRGGQQNKWLDSKEIKYFMNDLQQALSLLVQFAVNQP